MMIEVHRFTVGFLFDFETKLESSIQVVLVCVNEFASREESQGPCFTMAVFLKEKLKQKASITVFSLRIILAVNRVDRLSLTQKSPLDISYIHILLFFFKFHLIPSILVIDDYNCTISKAFVFVDSWRLLVLFQIISWWRALQEEIGDSSYGRKKQPSLFLNLIFIHSFIHFPLTNRTSSFFIVLMLFHALFIYLKKKLKNWKAWAFYFIFI